MNTTKGGVNKLREWLIGTESAPGLLVQKGMSVEQFAIELNLSRAQVYYYFKDVNRPRLETLGRMCRVLHVSMAEARKWIEPQEEGYHYPRVGDNKRPVTRKKRSLEAVSRAN